MTYNVSSGTLNTTMLCLQRVYCFLSALLIIHANTATHDVTDVVGWLVTRMDLQLCTGVGLSQCRIVLNGLRTANE